MVQTQTGFVPGQVPLHLHGRLHLHVVLEEAAAERGLVIGLPRRGLDSRLHPGLRHCGRALKLIRMRPTQAAEAVA